MIKNVLIVFLTLAVFILFWLGLSERRNTRALMERYEEKVEDIKRNLEEYRTLAVKKDMMDQELKELLPRLEAGEAGQRFTTSKPVGLQEAATSSTVLKPPVAQLQSPSTPQPAGSIEMIKKVPDGDSGNNGGMTSPVDKSASDSMPGDESKGRSFSPEELQMVMSLLEDARRTLNNTSFPLKTNRFERRESDHEAIEISDIKKKSFYGPIE